MTRSVFMPAPVDGLNLIEPPHEFRPDTNIGIRTTEARQLDNYHVFDWGIRERGSMTTRALPDAGRVVAMYPFTSTGYRSFLIATNGPNIYRYDGSNLFSASLLADFFWNAFSFARHIFMPRPATGEIARYALTSDTFAATSFTVGGTFVSNSGFAYKNRAYFLHDSDPRIYYYGVGAITGAIAGNFDFSEAYQRGRYNVWGTSWNFNQGNVNEELMVVCNDAGEVLVYSGDYPAASNWQIVARIDIPAPLLGYYEGGASPPYILPSRPLKVGQDLLIITGRGVISLAQILAGRANEERYFSISRKVGPVITGGIPGISSIYPFIYFCSNEDVYVLNYERGAWSKFPDVATGTFTGIVPPASGSATVNNVVSHIAAQTGPIVSHYNYNNSLTCLVLFALASGGFKEMSENFTTAESGANLYKWKTPFFDFGSAKQKTSKLIRVVGRATSGSIISNEVGIQTEFDDSTTPTEDAQSTTASDGGYRLQELSAPGSGTHISYAFQKTASASHQNEIGGFVAVFEDGGTH